MCFGGFTGQWAVGTGKWVVVWWDLAILQQGQCSLPKPTHLNWICREVAAGCSCVTKLPAYDLGTKQRCPSWAENRETGIETRPASSSRRAVLKQGWEAKVISRPAGPKVCQSPPGTPNSWFSRRNTEQTALTRPPATPPLDCANSCVWNQTGKYRHGFRVLCFPEEDVCHWGVKKNTTWTTWRTHRQVPASIWSRPTLETENSTESPQSSVTMRKVILSQGKVIRNQTTKLSAAKQQTAAIRKRCQQSNERDIEAVSAQTQVIFEGSWKSALGVKL